MFTLNKLQPTSTKMTWDLGDTLVRIKSRKIQEGAARASIALGFPISKYQIEKEIKAEWSFRKDDYHLKVIRQIDTYEKEYDYWFRDFYPSLFRRISGEKHIPLALLEFFCEVQMDPQNFELFPEAITVMDYLHTIGVEQAVVSNSFPSAIDIIHYHKIDRRIKFCIFSHECKLSKPDPKIYEMLEEKFILSGSDLIVFVDDRQEFLNIPKYLRILPVLFNHSNPQATWKGLIINNHEDLIDMFMPQSTMVFPNSQRALQSSLFA